MDKSDGLFDDTAPEDSVFADNGALDPGVSAAILASGRLVVTTPVTCTY